MSENNAQFLPFHAINEFMLSDFRHQVLSLVFSQLNRLPGERRSALNNLVKRSIQVPGFRNSAQAPAGVKARASATTFEKNPDFVGHVLQGWSELNPDLRDQVYAFLTAREWEILPADADRSKLPGFIPEWPEGQDYDVLGQGFAEMYPDATVPENDLRLMIVWLSGRLPYDMYEDDDETDESEEEEEENA